MSKRSNLVGQKFERLTVLKWIGLDKWQASRYLCICECGNGTEVGISNLRSGSVQSCGCLKIERTKQANTKHGRAGTRPYKTEKERERLRKYPTARLSSNMSRIIRYYLFDKRPKKNKKHWEDLVGYTRGDLMRHIEKKFKPGMTWDNYGEWHIDHIKPVSSFNFINYNDPEFKKCWALENLQPLWAEENLKKNNKILEG